MTRYNPLEVRFQSSGSAAAARMASVRWSDGGQVEQAVISKNSRDRDKTVITAGPMEAAQAIAENTARVT